MSCVRGRVDRWEGEVGLESHAEDLALRITRDCEPMKVFKSARDPEIWDVD